MMKRVALLMAILTIICVEALSEKVWKTATVPDASQMEQVETNDIDFHYSGMHAVFDVVPKTIKARGLKSSVSTVDNGETFIQTFSYTNESLEVFLKRTVTLELEEGSYSTKTGTPGGDLKLIRRTTIEGETRLNGELTVTDKHISKAIDLLLPKQDDDKDVGFSFPDLEGASIKGSMSLTLGGYFVGHAKCEMVHRFGASTNGSEYLLNYLPGKDEIENITGQIYHGEIHLGMKMTVGMSIKGLGNVISVTMGITAGVSSVECDQYDENLKCYDLPITFTIEASFKLKLGISATSFYKTGNDFADGILDKIEFTFFEDTHNFFKESFEFDRKHLEIKENGHISYLQECSIPESERKTFRFWTGTQQIIEDLHTRKGQTIAAPDCDDITPFITFVGWYTQMEGGELYDFTLPTDDNTPRITTIYAHYTEPPRKLTILFNCPEKEDSTEYYAVGAMISEPSIPMRMNWHFRGFWYEKPDGVMSNWNFETFRMPNYDLTLTAIWDYEEGYDPFAEALADHMANESYQNGLLEDLVFQTSPSTWISGALPGISHPAAGGVLHGISRVTGYTGSETVLILPELIDGKPLVYVDGSAFTNRDSLRILVLPPTVLAVSGFEGFKNLEYVKFREDPFNFVIKDDVTISYTGAVQIMESCFTGCKALQMVKLPASMQRIGDSVFENSGISAADLSSCSDLSQMGRYVFRNCKNLVSLSLPQHCTVLNTALLKGCARLNERGLDLSGIRDFREECLAGSGFTNAEIMAYSLEPNVFHGCEKLESLTVTLTESNAIGGWDVFTEYDMGSLPALKRMEITPADGAPISIRHEPGSGECSLPSLNELICNGPIKSLNMERVPQLQSIVVHGMLSDGLYLTDIPLLERIDVLPLTEESTLRIRLKNCPKLKMAGINNALFAAKFLELNNVGFDQLDFTGVKKPIDAEGIYISNMPEMTRFIAPDWIGEISYQISDNPSLTDIILPDTLQTMRTSSLQNNTALTRIHLPASMTDISAGLLSGCSSLREIEWPIELKTIELNAFKGCTSLTRLDFPETVQQLKGQLSGCTSLSAITLPSGTSCRESALFEQNTPVKRLTFRGTASSTEYISEYDPGVFVLVAGEETRVFRSTMMKDGIRACTIPYGAPEADQYVVRFEAYSYEHEGIVYDENIYARGAERIIGGLEQSAASLKGIGIFYKLFDEGELIDPPFVAMADPTDRMVGWYWDKDCTQPLEPNTRMPNRDIVLYAKWKQESNDFLFTAINDGAVVTGYQGQETDVQIPSYWNELPVVGIAPSALKDSGLEVLHLPDTITDLNAKTLHECHTLRQVEISSALYQTIGSAIFMLNKNQLPVALAYVSPISDGILTIPESVTSVNPWAVANCSKLTGVTFNAGLTEIDDYAFANCSGLTTIEFPETVSRIGTQAFAFCSSVMKVTFVSEAYLETDALPTHGDLIIYGPQNASQLHDYANANSQRYNAWPVTLCLDLPTPFPKTKYTIILEAGVNLATYAPVLDGYGFNGWKKGNDGDYVLIMPNQTIELHADYSPLYLIESGILKFVHPDAGNDISIPTSVVSIASGVRAEPSGTIRIPATVQSIADDAFGGAIKILGDPDTEAEAYAIRKGIPFEIAHWELVLDTNGGKPLPPIVKKTGEAIILPTPVRSYSEFTGWLAENGDPFNNSTMPSGGGVLTAQYNTALGLTIPFTWREEENGTICLTGYIGETEYPCVPETINGLPVTAIDAHAFDGNQVMLGLVIPATVESVGDFAFSHSALRSVEFSSENISFGQYTFFNARALQLVKLPNVQETIPVGFFKGCTSLTELNLPDSIRDIGASAFDGCHFLNSLTLPAALTHFDISMLTGLPLQSILVSDNNNVFKSDGVSLYSADGTDLLYLCREARPGTYIVRDGVTHIAQDALAGAFGVTSIQLPEGLLAIDEDALSGLMISELLLPQSLVEIGTRALRMNGRLHQVRIPENVTIASADALDPGVILLMASEETPAYSVYSGTHVILLDNRPKLTSIAIEPEKLNLEVGTSAQLTAILTPPNTSETHLYWESEDETIATVWDGKVTGVSPGETTIVAYSVTGIEASCTLCVEQEMSDFSLKIQDAEWKQKNTDILFAGESYYIAFSASDEDVTWTEKDEGITLSLIEEQGLCSLDGKRLVVSKEALNGQRIQLTIQVTLPNGVVHEKSIDILISENVGSIYADFPAQDALYVGDRLSGLSRLLTDSVFDSTACRIWSENEQIAHVLPTGEIEAVNQGTTVIRWYYPYSEVSSGPNTRQYGAMILRVLPSSCNLSFTQYGRILKGFEAPLPVEYDAPNATLQFLSSDEDLLTFNDNMPVVHDNGTVLVRARVVQGSKILSERRALFTVRIPYTQLHFAETFGDEKTIDINSKWTDSLWEGVSSQFWNASTDTITWKSSDPSVVSIDEEGIIKHHRLGEAFITATLEATGSSDTQKVVVDVESVRVSLDNYDTPLEIGEKRPIQVTIDPELPDYKLVWNTYSEDGQEYAEIDDQGIVTGITEGKTTVTLSIYDSKGKELLINDYEREISCSVIVNGPKAVTAIQNLPEALTLKLGEYTPLFVSESIIPAGADLYTLQVDSTASYFDLFRIEDGRKVPYPYYYWYEEEEDGNEYPENTVLIHGAEPGVSVLSIKTNMGNTYRCLVTVLEEDGSKPETYAYERTVFDLGADRIIMVGKPYQLDLTIWPENELEGRDLRWRAVDSLTGTELSSELISISEQGLVMANTPLSVIVYAELFENDEYWPLLSDSINLSIKEETSTLVLDSLQESVFITQDESFILPLTVNGNPALRWKYVFYSEDTQIATVNSEGVIRGIGAGSTSVHIQTRDGNYESIIPVICRGQKADVIMTLPRALKRIQSEAFAGMGMTEIHCLGPDLKEVESGAFRDCKDLRKVILVSDKVSIQQNAFEGCAPNLIIICPEDSETMRSAINAGLKVNPL